MSWSYTGIGSPRAVEAQAREQLNKVTCQQPEEAIKNLVLEILANSLLAFPKDMAVKVEAYGSQSTNPATPGFATNSLSFKIEPIYGFVTEKPEVDKANETQAQ